jgi:endothelin-converting enzyme/putative endopeptidase
MRCSMLLPAVVACSSPQERTYQPTPVPAVPARTSVELGDLDRSADPCVDFYQFANGAWRAKHPIPASMERWSRRWQAGEENKHRLSEILDEVSKKTDWPAHSVEQQIGDLYAACMDDKAADTGGATPIVPLLAEIDGMKTTKDVQRMLRRLHAIGVGVPFELGSRPDLHDPTRTIAEVAASGLGMPDRDYYFKTEPRFVEARAKYQDHLIAMFTLLGKKPAEAKTAADAVFTLETRLAKVTLDNVALRDPKNTDHPMKFEDLAKRAPHVDWVAYYDELKLPRGDLNLDQPELLAAVDKELTATPVASWRTYLAWHVVRVFAPWLSKPFVDEDFAFERKYLLGVAEMKPRATRCAQLVDEELGDALGKKYVDRYFKPAAKARAMELVQNELAAMKTIITGLTWMSDATKQKALAKLATFNPKVGYPDKWKDYSSITIERDALVEDLAATRMWNAADDRAHIGKPTDRGRWGATPPTSDAYYNALLNEIVFPAGILQPPAFDPDGSDALNYGAIGVVIGHEISHGFDDQGAKFDATGRLENWWTPDDLKAFQARGQCVIDQFESYFIEPGIHHNGKLVLGESIGDLGGVKIAFAAFQLARAAHPEPAPAGLTPDQEFFIGWGQFRGDETRPETQRRMVQGDPHPIAKFRVLGPLSNTPAFAKAFSCPASSPMIRGEKDRCEVW